MEEKSIQELVDTDQIRSLRTILNFIDDDRNSKNIDIGSINIQIYIKNLGPFIYKDNIKFNLIFEGSITSCDNWVNSIGNQTLVDRCMIVSAISVSSHFFTIEYRIAIIDLVDNFSPKEINQISKEAYPFLLNPPKPPYRESIGPIPIDNDKEEESKLLSENDLEEIRNILDSIQSQIYYIRKMIGD